MARKNSLQSIAEQLGTTKVTVWRAINDQPGVGAEMKEKILSYVRDTGRSVSQGKKERQSAVSRLAFFVSHRFFFENENFYTSIYYYLNKLSIMNSIDLTLFVVSQADEETCHLPSSFLNENFDGAFIAGELSENYIHTLQKTNSPVVLIDFSSPEISCDCVVADNYYLGYLAASKLLDMGHRQIGFVGGYKEVSNIMDRFLGFRKAMLHARLEILPEWLFNINDPITGLYSMNFALPEHLPTAIICHCDMAAYYLIDRLKTIGKSVPDDVSLISFDNTELCTKTTPALTSIEINRKEFAQLSFNTLCERISHPETPFQRKYVSTRLMMRASAKCVGK